MDQVLNINWERRARELLRRLDKRRVDGKFDFTIFVRNQKIHAEQNVLAAGSDYFDKMLSHDTKEKQEGELEMLEVDFESVKTCIDFIYGREVSVSPAKYEDLMLVADMMLLNELCDAIEETMEHNVDVKSLFSIRKVAMKFERTKLKKKCQAFAEDNFQSISKEEMFNEAEKPLMQELMTSSRVRVSEEKKLKILLKWVRSEEHRKQYLLELIKCIDISAIRPNVGESYIKSEPLINTNAECLLYFSLAVMQAMKPKNILLFCLSKNLRLFNSRTNKIDELTLVKPDFVNFSVVDMQGDLYFLGNDKTVHRLKYSDEGATWERMADMIDKHGQCPPATILSGFIYVIGSYHDECTKAVECFLPADNKWTKLQDKPQAIKDAEILTSGGFIYSFGGCVNNVCVNEVTRFDVSTSEWKNMSPMNKVKVDVAAAEWKGRIFVAGGTIYANNEDDDKIRYQEFERYDPSTDQWTILQEMNIARSSFKLIPIDGIFYAVGARFNSPHTIEKYDLMNNKWEMLGIDDGDELGIITSLVTFIST